MNVYNPVSVSVTKVDKIEVQLIAEELKRLTKILPSCQNEYRDRWRKELFQKLRKAMVLEERRRDPQLQAIIARAEEDLK